MDPDGIALIDIALVEDPDWLLVSVVLLVPVFDDSEAMKPE
jgi:hypothetical protein